jgi:phosphoribosylformylglycinamidine cyclo-ligase
VADRGAERARGLTYTGAGVDVGAADRAVDAIRGLVRSTYRPEVIGDIGGFGGVFRVPAGYRDPVLVASTDGVGTKIEVARAVGRYTTVGIDLVAMCVDDLVCQGAEPLLFLDYQALGRVDPDLVVALVEGIAEGCRRAGCALLGGELAEHPGSMAPGQFDLAGFAVGMVERDGMPGPERVAAGDALIGLVSPGLRSNGYSLARRALLEEAARPLDGPAWPGSARSLGEELLMPSDIYAPAVMALLRSGEVHAVAHITGGGIPGNLPRILPGHLGAVVRRASWDVPRIFAEIQEAGRVDRGEMDRVFNMGLGMIVALPAAGVAAALDVLQPFGHQARVVGEVVAGPRTVTYVGATRSGPA